MKNFRKLKVWEKAHLLTVEVYQVTLKFPSSEVYGLTSQIRRSSSSIPANIAEGCGRGGDAEFNRFLQIAFGSANELEYHLLLAHDLKLIQEDKYKGLDLQVTEIKRMLASLLDKIKSER